MGAQRHGGSSVPGMIPRKATPIGQYQRKSVSWASWTVTVLCLTEALTEEFAIQSIASSPRLRLLKRLLVTKKQLLVSTDDSFALQPTLALSCDVRISSSPPPGLVLLDMYEKNPNPFRINSLLAIHFSFCPTVRMRISWDYHTHPITPVTQTAEDGNTIDCPNSQGLCFKWLSQGWIDSSSIYSRHTL